MPSNATPNDTSAQSKTLDRTCTSRVGCCPLQTRWSLLLWALLIGVVIFLQWPMLKGTYYKATGAAAPPDGIAWRTDLSAALAEAKQSGKPVLVDFSASWCPPCQVMKHDAWPDQAVGQSVNKSYIALLVDVDDPASAAVSQRYGISGIPSILILNAEGKVLRQGGYMSRESLLRFLKENA